MKDSIRTFSLFAMFVFLAVLLVACGNYSGAGQSAAAGDTAISADGKNNAPVADAGPDQAVLTNSTVVLDGSGSYDPDNDPITYLWSFVSVPEGSTATLLDPTAVSPDFVADLEGTYEVSLLVSDSRKDDTDTVVINAVNTVPVTDTGQVRDNTPVFGEDSDYSINLPSFADNGDGTVSDQITGLMWEQDAWGTGTWNAAANYCDGLSLGGHTDWRVPNPHEIMSLFSYTDPNDNLIMDLTYFPFDPRNPVEWWTSQTYVDSPKRTSYAFTLDNKGYLLTRDKTTTTGIRCIRGEPYRTTQALVDNGDGTVSDLGSGLIWQQDDSVTGSAFEGAMIYCEDLVLAGYADWRLPNVKELGSLTDYSKAMPAGNTAVFPGLQPADYATSTAWQAIPTHWFVVNFGTGEITPGSLGGVAKCVRGGN